MRVFITGASGCVGHYLVHEFLKEPDNELVLLVRRPAKLRLPEGSEARVTVLQGDLREGAEKIAGLGRFDLGILAATAWGGPHTFDITVKANVDIADTLIAGGCPHVIYFASASVLDRDLGLLAPAAEHGTPYIRAKHKLVEEIEKRAQSARITGIFPTVIFGGGEAPVGAPLSHAARMLFENIRWLPVIRRLAAPGRLHFIHPADIATLTRHYANEGATDAARLVFGNPVTTVNDVIDAVARATGRRQSVWFRITEGRVFLAARVFGIKMTAWDRYCAENLDQFFPSAVHPGSVGLPIAMPDFATGLRAIGFPPKR